MIKRLALIIPTILCLLLPVAAWSNVQSCARCQRESKCNKVCRLVREERKVEVVCWGVASEDFCVPGPSQPGCSHCETICQSCSRESSDDAETANKPGAPIAANKQSEEKSKSSPTKPAAALASTPLTAPKKFLWTTWQPGRADIFTRQKLMKKTVTKNVPSYKWVVEELCPECAAALNHSPKQQ